MEDFIGTNFWQLDVPSGAIHDSLNKNIITLWEGTALLEGIIGTIGGMFWLGIFGE